MALIRKKYINQNKLIIIKNENFSFIFLSKQTFEILNVLTNMKVNQKEKIKNDWKPIKKNYGRKKKK